MASIKETKKGDYRIRVSAGFDGNGKRKFYTETYTPTAKTEKARIKEVEKYAAILEQNVHDGKVSISDGTTFEIFTRENWLHQWAKKNLRISQQGQYMAHLEGHVLPVIGNKKISKIKKADAIAVVNRMEDLGLAPATVRRVVSAMRSVFKYALYCDMITTNPCDNLILPKLQKTDDIQCFDVAQAQRFLKALGMKYPKTYGSRKRKDSSGNEYTVNGYTEYKEIPFQLQIYFTLAIQGGFRRGELIGLEWRDIDFDAQTITINRAVSLTKEHGEIVGEPKTPTSYRTVYMPAECIDMLAQWLDTQKEYCTLSSWKGMPSKKILENPVFIQANGKRMNLSTPEHRFRSILKAYNAMIEEEAMQLSNAEAQARKRAEKLPVIRLHDLRHTFATLLIGNNTDIVTVSKLMGHANPSVTMNVYSHLLKQNAKEAAQVFERLFNMSESKEITMQA